MLVLAFGLIIRHRKRFLLSRSLILKMHILSQIHSGKRGIAMEMNLVFTPCLAVR